MTSSTDLVGQKFGKLLVLEKLPQRENRYCLWRCRCACGNEVNVNTRHLRRGSIQGCAICWQRYIKNKPLDLTNQRFGLLTVLALSEARKHNRRTWVCLCDCGNTVNATTRDLRRGDTKSCGCYSAAMAKNRYRDLSGKVFGWLTILHATEKRDYKGSVIWHCVCKCGKFCDRSSDALLHGHNVSCGCYRETVLPQLLQKRLHRIDGTCVEHIKRKIRKDNKSGHTGVYELPNGKWKVYIGFKGKKYYLGTYKTKQEAVLARKKGEKMHDAFLSRYYNEHMPDTAQHFVPPGDSVSLNDSPPLC